MSMSMIHVPNFTHTPLQWFITYYLLPSKKHKVAYFFQIYYCTSYLSYKCVWLLSDKFVCLWCYTVINQNGGGVISSHRVPVSTS